MSKSVACGNAFLKLVYNGTPWPNVADNAALSPYTRIYVAFHTGYPGDSGSQATNEISYTGYARVPVARTMSGWTVTGNTVTSVAAVIAGRMIAGAGGTITYFSTGLVAYGATTIIHSGEVTPNIVVENGVMPKLGLVTITED